MFEDGEKKKDEKKMKIIDDSIHYLAFSNSSEPMSYTDDSTGCYLDVNKAYLDLLGYKKEEVIGKSIFELGLFTESKEAETLLTQLRKYGYVHNYPVTIKTKDGSIKYGKISTNTINYNNLTIRFTVMKDETERVKYENELKDREERYHTIVENTNDMIWIVDPVNFELTTFNSAVADYYKSNFGIILELGMTPKELVHEERVDYWNTMYTKAITDGSYKSEYEIFAGNKYLKLSLYPLKVDGELIGVSVFGQDITEKKKTELALLKEHESYQALIESTNDMIWIAESENYGLTLFNSSFANYFEKNFGIKVKNGMTPAELVPADRVELWNELYSKAIIEGPFKYECQTKSEDLFLVLSIAPLVVEDRIIGISVFAKDVTQNIKYKAKLEISHRKLAQQFQKSINAISKIGELRDMYTAGHQKRVQELACAIAIEMGLSDEVINNITLGALIHDIGKIYIASDTLNKPGKLTDLEYKILQTHAEHGYEVASEIDFPFEIHTMIYQHHERLDGSGYPQGLTGDKIIIESRILSVADVVDAMSSHRPYRPALGIDVALEEVSMFKGTKYDSEVVDICINLFKEKGFKFTSI